MVEIALLAFDDFTILFIAWVGIDDAAPTAEDIVVVRGGNVGLRLLRMLLLGLESGCGGGGDGGG